MKNKNVEQETPQKPKLCKILGVEVNETFEYHNNLYFVREDGFLTKCASMMCETLVKVPIEMIEHADKIQKLVPINELKGINENEKNN